jgi:hypothetical protein
MALSYSRRALSIPTLLCVCICTVCVLRVLILLCVDGGSLRGQKPAESRHLLFRNGASSFARVNGKLPSPGSNHSLELCREGDQLLCEGREKQIRGSGGPLAPLGLFLCAPIPCIWSILSAFLPS